MKFVPELEEEQFQSMVAVPILARDGNVIGVIVLHTVAPREFDDGVLNFLVHTASLVAGAIENAKLYEGTRRRVDALTTLTQLSPGARGGDAPRGPLRRRHSRRPPAPRRRRVPDLAGGRGRGRAEPGRRRPAGQRAAAGARRAAARPHAGRAHRGRGRRAGGRPRSRRATSSSGILCCIARGPRLRRRGRRAAARRGAPDRGGAEEGGADRAAHRREHREGHVRGAGRRVGGGRRGEGGGGALRPLAPARVPARGACARGSHEGAPAWPDVAAHFEGQLRRLYPRAFFDSRHDFVRAIAPLPTAGAAAVERLRQGCEELARADGRRGGAERRGPRRGEREAADARGRRRGADRALARARRRRGLLRGARRLQVPRPPRAGRRAARPLPPVGRGADRVRPQARRRAWWRRSSASLRTAAAWRRARGRSTSTRTLCVSGSSGSSG